MPASQLDRKFMEMAVAEMRRSRSEHTTKHDPLVGAVLVGKKGKLLGTTHRGDLRVGDHAEFTLIERYLQNQNLEGATLYVTLEPCTRRNPPKKPCADRIIKARIGRVFVGMTDPNPDICGRGVQHLLNHGVEVDFFDIDLVKQVREANKVFIEYYETSGTNETPGKEPFEGPSRRELEVVERASLNELSPEVLAPYLALSGSHVAVSLPGSLKRLER